MSSYRELLQQREALTVQIEEARKREIADAVSRVRSVVTEYGLEPKDVFPNWRPVKSTAGTKVAPKYRDPISGKTWTGRGKPPKWIAGQDRSLFAIV